MNPRTRTRPTDTGAVAVMVALLATVVFAAGAISVDLGNAWARKRDAQTQADLAALSAGYLLPMTSANRGAIAAKVAEFLNDNNTVVGQAAVTGSFTGPDLVDLDASNGELYFDAAGTRMRFVTPEAWVDWGLAAAFRSEDGIDVQASATVEVMSPLPPMQDMLPLWLPDGCPFGPGMADTGSGGGGGKADTATPTTSAGPFVPGDKADHTTGAVTPSSVPFATSQTVQVTITNLPKNSDGGKILFTRDASTVVTFEATWDTTAEGASVTVDVPVTTTITGTGGTWQIWPLLSQGNKEYYPQTPGALTVTGAPSPSSTPTPSPTPTPTTVGCASSGGGQFGQLDSPRRDESQHQRALAENIAVGLDHLIMPFVGATSAECGKKNQAPPTGGVQDDDPDKTGVNCIMLQTGNDGPWMLKGLVTGTDRSYGRLDARNGSTRPGCGRSDDVVEGTTINNDVLSCFLRDGYSLDDIAQPTGVDESMLDPAVVDSPRFVWLPVIYASDRDDVDNNTFYAIKRFVPGFITYQNRTATKANPGDDPTDSNGVVLSGQLEAIQVFTFNPDALPVNERAMTVPYDPLAGSIVRLVD